MPWNQNVRAFCLCVLLDPYFRIIESPKEEAELSKLGPLGNSSVVKQAGQRGFASKVPEFGVSMGASVLGIASMVSGRYRLVEYLDPFR